VFVDQVLANFNELFKGRVIKKIFLLVLSIGLMPEKSPRLSI